MIRISETTSNGKKNINLDYLCAKYGQKIPEKFISNPNIKIKEVENLIRNSFGVIQEDGLFAFVIFLESKKGNEGNIASAILEQCKDLIIEAKISEKQKIQTEKIREEILNITSDLDKMFLTKNIIERCLTYAIYRAKALSNQEQEDNKKKGD